MLQPRDAQIISDLFYILDSNGRNDLYNNRIADERDYVSRMVTHFNYPFGIFNVFLFNHIQFKSQWFARVNSGHHERKFGCDSMIVFKVNNEIKVGLFEGKWPRVICDPNHSWDYTQKSTKKSHFTNQIRRQARWISNAAIWEMFFYEEKVGKLNAPFDIKGSTCIRHQYAMDLINQDPSPEIIWDNSDLLKLIQSEQIATKTIDTNLKKIIFDILTCSFGKTITIKPTDKTFTLIADNDERARCPILTLSGDNEDNQFAEQFMKETRISFFQQLNITLPNEGQ